MTTWKLRIAAALRILHPRRPVYAFGDSSACKSGETLMSDSVLGYFHLDLYRLGNYHENKLDAVRDRDVERVRFYRSPGNSDSKVQTGRAGEVEWIVAGPAGGISLFDDIPTAPISGKHWYKIPAGVKIPTGLALYAGRRVAGKATHYTLHATVQMPMDNFKALLRTIAVDAKITPLFDTTSHSTGKR
jgi:hypothetical protein